VTARPPQTQLCATLPAPASECFTPYNIGNYNIVQRPPPPPHTHTTNSSDTRRSAEHRVPGRPIPARDTPLQEKRVGLGLTRHGMLYTTLWVNPNPNPAVTHARNLRSGGQLWVAARPPQTQLCATLPAPVSEHFGGIRNFVPRRPGRWQGYAHYR